MPTIFRANTGKCVHVTKQRITCVVNGSDDGYSVQSRDIRERHGAFSDFSIVTYGSLAIMTVVERFFFYLYWGKFKLLGVSVYFFSVLFFLCLTGFKLI